MKKLIVTGLTVLSLITFTNTFADDTQDFHVSGGNYLSGKVLQQVEGCPVGIRGGSQWDLYPNQFEVACWVGAGSSGLFNAELSISVGKDTTHQCSLVFWANVWKNQKPSMVSASCSGGYHYNGMVASGFQPFVWEGVGIQISHS